MSMPECNVLFIQPKFPKHTFWGLQETCRLVGARHPTAPLGLITVAALLPTSWNIRLVDRNLEEVSEADFAWADVVMTGGMLPQQHDTAAVIDECQAKGKIVVVGGPDATSSPDKYARADFQVLGEAEGAIDDFLDAWNRGERSGTFTAPKFDIDVTKTPIPRFDLIKLDNYIFPGVQFSRGCPFNCEFCDIIELFGRVPRTKTNEQMLAELDALYELGHRGQVDFVDDNLIGNKKALRLFLPELIAWQEARKYPFEFSTEASLNLADDVALMQQMAQAGFFHIFVGIESPDPDVLIGMQKKQNTRRDISESVHKIYAAGIMISAGFIVGFDDETGSVADSFIDLIDEAAIPTAMVGLLYALPNTQLTRRLESEGRLGSDAPGTTVENGGDQCVAGLNFQTRRPRRDIMLDYRTIVADIYTPERFIGRVHRLVRALKMTSPINEMRAATLWPELKQLVRVIFGLYWRMPHMRPHLWSTIKLCIRENPPALKAALGSLALYAHSGPFAGYVLERLDEQIAELDAAEAAMLSEAAE